MISVFLYKKELITFMEQFFNYLGNLIIDFVNNGGVKILASIAVLFVGLLLILIITRFVKKKSVESRKLDNSAAGFITAIVSLVVYIGLFILVLAILGFSTSGIIAAFGSVALAISLGLQNTLSSLTNGIVLIFTRPFKQGDYVNIGGTEGTIKEIKLFSVKLVTTENITVIIPNSTVLNSVITNYSNLPSRRIELVIPTSYSCDIDKVKEVLLDIVKNDKRILEEPYPFCRLTEYADSSLNFTLRVYTSSDIFWDVKYDLMENIVKKFNECNIDIPFNILDVHISKGDD